MSILAPFSGLQIVTPNPSGDGGLALNENFRKISTNIQTSTNPGTSNDYTQGFRIGSRWINMTTPAEFVCTDSTSSMAVWLNLSQFLPLVGGTLTGGVTLTRVNSTDTNGTILQITNPSISWTNVDVFTQNPNGSTFIGDDAPHSSTTYHNVAIGESALHFLTSGFGNTGVGWVSFANILDGAGNAGLGKESGGNINHGSYNSFLGYSAGYTDGTTATTDVSYSAAIGAYAQVTADYCIVLGGTGSYAVNVGIGTTAPSELLEVIGTAKVSNLKLVGSSAPSSPVAGQIYYDSGTNHFYGWNGSAWKQLDN